MVDERKLQALSDQEVMRVFRSGELAWIYSHLFSMGNFNRLIARAAVPDAAAVAEKIAAPGKAARKK